MPEINYASKGLAGSALGLAIGALGVTALNGGIGNLFNGANGNFACHENTYVNRYELEKEQEIASLKSQIALRDATTFTLGEVNKMRDYFETKFTAVEKEICDQKVYNTANTAALNCLSGQVAQLMNLTKLVVPISSICPTPAVATTTATTTAG